MKTVRNPLELLRQSLKWTTWDQDSRLELSSLQVPVDYDQITGRHIEIHISRLRVDSPDQRLGVLIALNGGPGGAESMGIAMPLRLAGTPLTSRYDIIGVDVRGYGKSSPLRYKRPEPTAPFTSRPTASDFEAFAHDARAMELACAEASPELRPHVTTRNIARDLEAIRVALGEDRLNMLGSAYGTSIVTTYGDMFPERLDRSVLDSCVHPEWSWEEQFRMQSAAIQRNVSAWADWVAARHSVYQLGFSGAHVLERVESLSWALGLQEGSAALDQTTFDIAVGNGATLRKNWAILARSIVALHNGAVDHEAVRKLETWARQGLRAGTTPSFGPGEREARLALNPREEVPKGYAEGQTSAITCETPWPRDLNYYRRNVKVHLINNPYGLGVMRALPWCSAFNVNPPREVSQPLGPRNYPVGLVIQAEGDPLDPFEGGVAMAEQLSHNIVLVADDGGHDLYPSSQNPHIDEAVENYLLHGELPRERMRWVAGEARPEVPSDHFNTAGGQHNQGLGSRDVPLADLVRWMDARRRTNRMETRVVPIASLGQWSTRVDGTLVHNTGRFFSIAGVHVTSTQLTGTWTQPIIHQPEVGILGFLAKQIDSVPYVLVQAKVEPGDPSGTQIAPTVQATSSNYTAAHCGSEVPYVEYFLNPSAHKVILDCEQSEHGQWYYDKFNRNIVIEVKDEVPEHPNYRWMSLEQVYGLLSLDDMVNMSARSVLGSLHVPPQDSINHDSFTNTVLTSLRSYGAEEYAAFTEWLDERRSHHSCTVIPQSLTDLEGWAYTPVCIGDTTRSQFDVIGVSVTAAIREVTAWDQPMITPHGTGLVVLFVKDDGAGCAQALARVSVEPGLASGPEIGPTLQMHSANPRHLSANDSLVLKYVRSSAPQNIWYDSVQSEEGGRIYDSHTRYMIIKVDDDFTIADPDYRWAPLGSWTRLAAAGGSVNVQARTLLAAARSRCGNSQPGHTYANYINEEVL